MSDSIDLSDIVDDFLADSIDCVDQFERDIKALELQPNDTDLLGSAFRCLHSIKGTSAFLGFGQVETLAHAGENLLAAMRAGERRLDGAVGRSLARLGGLLREILAEIERTGGDTGIDIGPLCAELDGLQSPRESRTHGRSGGTTIYRPSAANRPADDRSQRSVRVEVSVLDRLIDLAGELTTAGADLQGARSVADGVGCQSLQRVRSLAAELYSDLLQARLQDLGGLWRHAQRIAQDLAGECGKSVDVIADHAGMHLDRRLVEALVDPLIHMIRNAVDHGLEPAEQRLACGKPATGVLQLGARLDAGQLVIEVADDGAGIDRDRVRATALRQGNITAERLAEMTDGEILALVLQAGFSTTDRITKLSGRGVGMDVVCTKVAELDGEIELESHEGRGTVVRMRFPLSIAMLPVLTLHRGEQRIAVPATAVIDRISLRDRPAEGIACCDENPALYVEGERIPLVDPPEAGPAWRPGHAARAVGIILAGGGRRCAVLVDRVTDTGSVIARPDARYPSAANAIAAATADGPIPLLDAGVLTARAHRAGDADGGNEP